MESKPTDYFRELGRVHKPQYMWIGCSDARVPANEIMGLGPGEVFVHRNVANLVVSSDVNLLTGLTYAVSVLKVKHVIGALSPRSLAESPGVSCGRLSSGAVCGHYDCGGIRAAASRRDHGVLETWLTYIRDVARLHFVGVIESLG